PMHRGGRLPTSRGTCRDDSLHSKAYLQFNTICGFFLKKIVLDSPDRRVRNILSSPRICN
ncbi:MAG: hypothetical protein ACKO1T_05050, partial [Sediminibacterium sp.]